MTKQINREDWNAVLQKALNHNSEALGKLCKEYLYNIIYRWARSRVQNHHEAEDRVGEVFEKFIKTYPKLRNQTIEGCRAFVRQITINQCNEYFRKKGVEQRYIERLSQNHPKVDVAFQEKEQERAIIEAERKEFLNTLVMGSLSEPDRALLSMKGLQDLTYWEISARNGKSDSTLSDQYKKIPHKLKNDEMLVTRLKELEGKGDFLHSSNHDDLYTMIECAEHLYRKACDYQGARKILELVLQNCTSNYSNHFPKKISYLKAQVYAHLTTIYLQQGFLKKSLFCCQMTLDFCKSIQDRENQAIILFNMGRIFADIALIYGGRNSIDKILKYYSQANCILSPSMKTFNYLKSRYYRSLAGLYYHILDENIIAKEYAEKGLDFLQQSLELCETTNTLLGYDDAKIAYKSSKQYLGRIFCRLGMYDKAYDLIETISKDPSFQSLWFQTKTFSAFCELFLSIGEIDKGIELAAKAKKICEKLKTPGHYLILQQILERHNLSPSIIEF